MLKYKRIKLLKMMMRHKKTLRYLPYTETEKKKLRTVRIMIYTKMYLFYLNSVRAVRFLALVITIKNEKLKFNSQNCIK